MSESSDFLHRLISFYSLYTFCSVQMKVEHFVNNDDDDNKVCKVFIPLSAFQYKCFFRLWLINFTEAWFILDVDVDSFFFFCLFLRWMKLNGIKHI